MNKVLIIAEAGVNHNGDINQAKRLIDVAADAGVDYVKFQTFKAENIVSKNAQKAEYQISATGDKTTQYEMIKALELSDEQHQILIQYCRSKGLKFFSTAFDISGLEYLNSLGFKIYKVPSGEITNFPYLKKLASFKKPVILSTGMADLKEINEALEVLTSEGLSKKDVTVLHCNTEYPTPMEDVNLKAMNTIGKTFDVAVGYSDHTLGIEVPIAAVALGASVIEKHFTLNRNLPGPDHKASIEPDELKALVRAIRNIEKALGDGIKKPSESEQKNINIARKSIHISKALPEGTVLKEENLIMKRPGNGISPKEHDKIIGRKLRVSVKPDHQLKWEDLV